MVLKYLRVVNEFAYTLWDLKLYIEDLDDYNYYVCIYPMGFETKKRRYSIMTSRQVCIYPMGFETKM